MIGPTRTGLLLMLCCFLGCSLRAQVSFERLVRAPQEPQNWLTYSGSYLSQRYSPLQQVDLANVKNLEFTKLLPDVVTIADEVDAQLKQQMKRFKAADAGVLAKVK